MYLIAFFFLFSLRIIIAIIISTALSKEQDGGQEGRERRGDKKEGRDRTGGGGRAQYKPHPRRLLAMMISVTASNTTWMFPVSVAQVM